MNLTENLQMAFKTLRANKLRSALTMLGIIIGNASVIAIVAIGQGTRQFTQGQLEAFGPNQLTRCDRPAGASDRSDCASDLGPTAVCLWPAIASGAGDWLESRHSLCA